MPPSRYKGLRHNKAQETSLDTVINVLGCERTKARALLIHYQWNTENLMGTFAGKRPCVDEFSLLTGAVADLSREEVFRMARIADIAEVPETSGTQEFAPSHLVAWCIKILHVQNPCNARHASARFPSPMPRAWTAATPFATSAGRSISVCKSWTATAAALRAWPSVAATSATRTRLLPCSPTPPQTRS